MERKKLIDYPIDPQFLLRKKVLLKKELLQSSEDYLETRIAIVGGSTTSEIKNILEIFLLDSGIKPSFYEGEYNRFYEELTFPNKELKSFKPEIIYIHTSEVNIKNYPNHGDSNRTVNQKLKQEFNNLKGLWEKVEKEYGCIVIQNNFELPYSRYFGNLDFSDTTGKTNFIHRLNELIAGYSRNNSNIIINDINYLSSWIGLEKWFNKIDWYSYKYSLAVECIPFLAQNLAALINAVYGKNKKALVLDLDNTLWGGVIGDDGVENIKIGKETALSESFTAFQQYLYHLKERGILLTICSKNDKKNAEEGLAHPDSILSKEDFISFKANWEPKSLNVLEIAKEVNIGLDSLVFVDDSPAERELIRQQIISVEVPEMGSDVTDYISILDKSGFFEVNNLSKDDQERNQYYQSDKLREKHSSEFLDYEGYLNSLEMEAEISTFKSIYLDRITQLINKTNQFNLTTKRYASSEISKIHKSKTFLPIYGRLKDKFGDNGLISIIIGSIERTKLFIDLWVMSCRVIKRDMELAMFDSLVLFCKSKGIKEIEGSYLVSEKNNMVKDLYHDLGFKLEKLNKNGDSKWVFKIPARYSKKNKIISLKNE